MSSTLHALSASSAASGTLIAARWYDYIPIAIYFAFVIGVGLIARAKAATADGFLTSGRSLPAWVTGIAFVSANLGAVEIMGMSANGAEYGMPTFHYFWIGAVPAMIFLGLVMMPFYYGSKVRSVPEFMLKRYGTAAHLVNALSFALAQLLIAGINLYLLGKIMNWLLGWPLWVGLIVAAVIVFSYITMGGLSAAIYNEVLQFFVIVAALLPLTLIGLHRVGGWHGLTDKITAAAKLAGTASAQSTPIIGTFVKMFVPFLVIVPGMVAGVMVTEVQQLKSGANTSYQYNDAVLYLMRDLLPNGLLGLAITGLLASFMAGMAANISAFNTVWGVDIYQHYLKKDADDAHYLKVGKLSTLTASVVAILTAIIASSYSNLMDYLQTLFSMFNAPLFATFIIGMFWKRATSQAGWIGLVGGTLGSLAVNILVKYEFLVLPGQGGAFLAAGVAFSVDVVITVLVSLVTEPKPDSELKGFAYALTPKSERTDPHLHELPWFRRPIPLGIIAGALVITLNSIFH